MTPNPTPAPRFPSPLVAFVLLALAGAACGPDVPNAIEDDASADAARCLVSPGAAIAASRQFGIDQTDVFYVDRSGRPNVSWVYGAGSWNGPAPLSASWVARSGAGVAAMKHLGREDQTDLFFVDRSGAVAVTSVVGVGAWSAPQRITATGVAPSDAAIAVSNQFGIPWQTDVFFVDAAGAVNVLWGYDGRWYGPARITATGVAPAGGAVAVSNQFGIPDQTDVFFVDTSGAVNVLWVVGAGAWNGPARITATGVARGGAALAASNQFGIPWQTDVFFVDAAGAVNVLWVVGAGAWNGPARITPVQTAPSGGAVAVSQQFGLPGQTDVFFVDAAGAVNVLWVVGAGAWNGPARITATGAAPAGGALAASAQFGVEGQTDVHFVDSGCALNVLWVQWGGAWSWARNFAR